MKLDYRRDIHTRTLIISPDADGSEISYRLKMITSNEIPGFLRCTCEYLNGAPVLYYDISGLQPLSRLFEENRADPAFFRNLTGSLLSAFMTLREYLLGAEDVLLTKDTIFMDVKTREIRFVCFPFEEKNVDEQLKDLAAFLLSKAAEEAEAIKIAYRFYTACTGSGATAEALMEILRQIEATGRQAYHGVLRPQAYYGVTDPQAFHEASGQSTYHEAPGQSAYHEGPGSEAFHEFPGPQSFHKTLTPSAFHKASTPSKKEKSNGRDAPVFSFGIEKEKKNRGKNRGGIGEKKKIFGFLKKQKEPKEPKRSGTTPGWEEYRRPVEDPFLIPNEPREPFRKTAGKDPGNEAAFFAGYDDGETVVLSGHGQPGTCGTDGAGGAAAWLVPADIFFGETIEMTQDSYVIGRGRASDVLDIGAKAASRRHAALSRRAGSYEISDLGSKNGTFVNDVRLAQGERRLLADGDRVKFADAEYHFCLTEKKEGIILNTK